MNTTRGSDAVDLASQEWADEWPDLDVGPGQVLARIQRLARIIEERQNAQLRRGPSRHIANLGDLDVLRTLRRVPAPHSLPHGRLVRGMLVSAAGMTGRLARLESAGWITREPAPSDARSSMITLTPEGLADLDDYLPRHYAFEASLLAGATSATEASLATGLRALLVDLES